MGKGLFITATGTDIGKTFVTALIVQKLRDAGLSAGYYKAALSGATRIDGKLVPGDAVYVCQTAGLETKPEQLVSYIYENAWSPHLAAREEGNAPEIQQIAADYQKQTERWDYVTVEGSGGIICPIRYDSGGKLLLEDILYTLNLPSLIIADAGLGTINATVLTVAYMRSRNLPVKGIILNRFLSGDMMQEDNRSMIEELTGCPVVAVVPPDAKSLEIDLQLLTNFYQ